MGYKDGEVYSLPNRVQLAPALPDVVDFAGVCSESFALTRSGLFRLTASESSPVGTWTPVDIDTAMTPDPTRFFAAQLAVDGTTVYVVNRYGTIIKLDAQCL